MVRKVKVAIIGAGLTGLIAATQLKANGIEDVVVIDKGRSVGGRLATRRIENGRVDHGAQFFTVRTDAFRQTVDAWLQQDLVRKWFGDNHPRYFSVGGMNALAKHLAKDVETIVSTRVVTIEKNDGYVLEMEDGKQLQAETVVVTAPMSQTIDLVKEVASEEQLAKLATVEYDPCLVGIFELGEGATFSANGHQDKNLPEGVLRIVEHEKKGISSIPTVSVYMTGDFSLPRYEQSDEQVLPEIKELTKDLLPLTTLKSDQLKRWKYAQVKTAIVQDEPFIQLDDQLFVAGDAFLTTVDKASARIESAFLSGEAVAKRVQEFYHA